MTWYNELSIECATAEQATQLSSYFKEIVKTYIPPYTSFVTGYEYAEGWWVVVHFEYKYINADFTYLYNYLQQSNLDYRYALAGIETSEFRTYSELIEDLPTITIPGLVISTKLVDLTEALCKSYWKPFAAGYIWQPYIPPHNLVN
jgi:hypothetical protein